MSFSSPPQQCLALPQRPANFQFCMFAPLPRIGLSIWSPAWSASSPPSHSLPFYQMVDPKVPREAVSIVCSGAALQTLLHWGGKTTTNNTPLNDITTLPGDIRLLESDAQFRRSHTGLHLLHSFPQTLCFEDRPGDTSTHLFYEQKWFYHFILFFF